jgi:predicted TIM-barrel fold metal-dependent hydrolase
MAGFVSQFSNLVFGGVFDRHPDLRVVFVEGGIGWIPKTLYDADVTYETRSAFMETKIQHTPSWYWFKHCYATFMTDPIGLENLERIGADRVMWAADYLHAEGTLSYTQSAIQAVFDATTVENAQKILGLTALQVFGME